LSIKEILECNLNLYPFGISTDNDEPIPFAISMMNADLWNTEIESGDKKGLCNLIPMMTSI
jgi:hypothetical protein